MLDSYELFRIKKEAYGDGTNNQNIDEDLIKNVYDFARFYENGKEYSENGATVVFTGKQYIFLKNGDNGQQGHVNSFARIYLAMEGDNSKLSFIEACRVAGERDRKYLRMTFEAEDGKYRDMYKSIRVFFYGEISQEELASFKAFYDQYEPIIDTIQFSYFVRDEKTKSGADVRSMEELYEYLKTIVDENKVPYESPRGELIIGTSNGYDTKINKKVYKC